MIGTSALAAVVSSNWKMEWIVPRVWVCVFGSSLEIQYSVEVLLWISGFWFLFQEFGYVFCFLGATPFVAVVRPGKFTFCTSGWHLFLLSLRLAFRRQSETAREFLSNFWGIMAAMPISSMYCAHWSVVITGPRYLRMKLDKADRERLCLFANHRCANILLARLNARISMDWWSAIWRHWLAWEQSSLNWD